MGELEPPRVQRLALEQHLGIVAATDLAAGDQRAAAVLAIAKDRAAGVVQVDANLVGPPRLGQHLDRGEALEPLNDLVEGLRRLAFPAAANRHFLPLDRVDSDWPIDQVAIVLGRAGDEGEILLFHRAIVKQRGQLSVRQVVLGHEDHAACVAVEAVDDPGPGRPARGTQLAGKPVL